MTVDLKKFDGTGDPRLRRDFRLLTWEFRRVVVKHCGEETWKQMYQLRSLAEERQAGDAKAEEKIADFAAAQSIEHLTMLARIIGMFFDLANLAEDLHRIRVLQERETKGKTSETIPKAIETLRGLDNKNALTDILSKLNVEPVFTAHPTEAKRRTIRRALRRVREDLALLNRPGLSRDDRRQCLTHMRAAMTALWATDSISTRKPTVIEELQRTIYMARTLWRVAPRVVAQLRDQLLTEDERSALQTPLQFGNWIGGDRDGNPYVTCDVTLQSLSRLRAAAISHHREICNGLSLRLTVASDQCDLPGWLKTDIDSACMRWPELAQDLEPEHPHEWIVHWLKIIDRRLSHSVELPFQNLHPMAYTTAAALAEDVAKVEKALNEAGLEELTVGPLSRWADRIRIFGLHMLRLDIRVNAVAVRNAADFLLSKAGVDTSFQNTDEASRQAILSKQDPNTAAAISLEGCDTGARDLIDVLTLLQRVARAGDTDAFGQVIVSMTHYPSDILAVVWLMRVAAFRAGFERPVPVPVTPLFETIRDLQACDTLLEVLLADAHFSTHLDSCNRSLTCMVGYSDSAKDGGYMGANWELYNAQRRLAACAKKHGTSLTIFHGRGGAIGRGGGPTARAILSLPREAVEARLRLTEQGEVIAERYDDPLIATRHLEQLFWATLVQSSPQDDKADDDAEAFASELSRHSVDAYHELVEMPVFESYLQFCTALPLIESLPLGSRPSRRSKTTRLEDLRAIPFTFAWNQVRMPINAFYGLGSAFERMGPDALKRAEELYKTWPWFKAVINNAELALARCDAAIARRYVEGSPDKEAALDLWRKLQKEVDLSCAAVLAIKQESELIEGVPWLRRTVRIRTPYLDILNLFQTELMSRHPSPGQKVEDQELDAALRLTVQSIAAGLRNTG